MRITLLLLCSLIFAACATTSGMGSISNMADIHGGPVAPAHRFGVVNPNCSNPPTNGVSGPAFAANLGNCLNGVQEIAPLLGSNTHATDAVAFDFDVPQGGSVQTLACPWTMNFPANFAGSTVECTNLPSETDDYLLKVDGTLIGDISITTGCVAALTTVNSTPRTCNTGSRLDILAPVAVSGHVSFTLVYTK